MKVCHLLSGQMTKKLTCISSCLVNQLKKKVGNSSIGPLKSPLSVKPQNFYKEKFLSLKDAVPTQFITLDLYSLNLLVAIATHNNYCVRLV